MVPGEMTSTVVSFTLTFPTRRALQATDTSSSSFYTQLKQSLAAGMANGITESNILLVETGVPGELQVIVTGLEGLAQSIEPSVIVASVSDPTFITQLSADLGVSIILTSPPSITTRVTPVPSPPPPPSSPAPPQSPPLLIVGEAITTRSDLNGEWVLVIVLGSLTFLTVVGCFVTYYYGKRVGTKTNNVGIADRPSASRAPSEFDLEDADGDAATRSTGAAATTTMPMSYARNVPLENVHLRPIHSLPAVRLTPDEIALVEIGMQVQLAREASNEGSLSPRSPRSSPRGSPSLRPSAGGPWVVEAEIFNADQGSGIMPSNDDLSIRLDRAQATIDAVRESLNDSPQGGARAQATVWMSAREASISGSDAAEEALGPC